jgi:hypothetical protein
MMFLSQLNSTIKPEIDKKYKLKHVISIIIYFMNLQKSSIKLRSPKKLHID